MAKYIKFFMILVMTIVVASCSTDEPDLNSHANSNNNGGNKEPEVSLVSTDVEGLGCTLVSATWSSKNAELKKVVRSRAASSSVNMDREDAFAAVKVSKSLNASVKKTYSDGSVKTEQVSRSYNETDHFGFYGLADKRFVSDIAIFNQKPAETTEEVVNGMAIVYNFSGFKFAVKIDREKSAKSFTIEGQEVATCDNDIKVSFIEANVIDANRDSISGDKKYHLYKVNFTAHVTIDNGGEDLERDVIVASANVWDVNEYVAPTPDPELVDYIWEEEGIAFVGEDLISTGTLYELWSDGSKRNPQVKRVALKASASAPADQVKTVENMYAWNTLSVTNNDALNGNNRTDGEFTIYGYSVVNTLSANYFSCAFVGTYEKAYFTAPNGKEIEMPYAPYSFDNTIANETGESHSADYNSLYLVVSTSAYICGKSENLSSNVELREAVVVTPDPVQTGIRVENEHVDGDYIVFDVVRTFDSKADETETVLVRHNAGMSVESPLTTALRQYGVVSSNASLVRESEFFESAGRGNVSGKVQHMVNVFGYADFTNNISYYFPANLVYSENGFSAPLNIAGAAVNKVGSETSVEPVSANETSKTFEDAIFYTMIFGGNEVANGAQVVVYTENVTPAPEPEPTYVGYHVVASKSYSTLVIDSNWGLFVADMIAFEKDDMTETFYHMEVYKSNKNGDRGELVYSNKKFVCELREYPCATYTANGEWAPAYLTADKGEITASKVEGWYQNPLTANGQKVKVSTSIAATLQVKTPLLNAGNWNANAKEYTLNGVSYR